MFTARPPSWIIGRRTSVLGRVLRKFFVTHQFLTSDLLCWVFAKGKDRDPGGEIPLLRAVIIPCSWIDGSDVITGNAGIQPISKVYWNANVGAFWRNTLFNIQNIIQLNIQHVIQLNMQHIIKLNI